MKYWNNYADYTSWNLHYVYIGEYMENIPSDARAKIQLAIQIVEKLHDEPRMDGTGNMKVHLLRVARVLIEELQVVDFDLVLIALLHDVLEDTDYSAEQIKEVYGAGVLEGVQLLTRPRDRDWKEHAEEVAIKYIRVFKVKVADKLDNARSHLFSKNEIMRQKDYIKTKEIMLPLVKKYSPEHITIFEDVINKWYV